MSHVINYIFHSAFPKGKPPQVWCPEEALKFQSKIEKVIQYHLRVSLTQN